MTDAKRVVVTGATGLIGKRLCERLVQQAYQVVIFSRSPQRARKSVPGAAEYIAWDYRNVQGGWVGALNGAYGVVHLAGAPIFGKRWSESYKAELRDSRVLGTRALVEAMQSLQEKPEVFVSGSAVGYYGHRDDRPLDESAAPGTDFLARLCVAWEEEASKASALGIRTVLLRTGIVLDANEGALAQLKTAFQLYMGGPVLPGTQWFSWVHVDDLVGIILLALENSQAMGPINGTAPEPLTNRDFSATLGKVMGVPSWLPVPGFGLKILLGELADNLVHGQRVLPNKAQELGYEFRYPTAQQALHQLLPQR